MERTPVNKAITIVLESLKEHQQEANSKRIEQVAEISTHVSRLQEKLFRYKITIYILTAVNVGLLVGLVLLQLVKVGHF